MHAGWTLLVWAAVGWAAVFALTLLAILAGRTFFPGQAAAARGGPPEVPAAEELDELARVLAEREAELTEAVAGTGRREAS